MSAEVALEEGQIVWFRNALREYLEVAMTNRDASARPGRTAADFRRWFAEHTRDE